MRLVVYVLIILVVMMRMPIVHVIGSLGIGSPRCSRFKSGAGDTFDGALYLRWLPLLLLLGQ